jgi:MYXO-CTERM domain-containing protein
MGYDSRVVPSFRSSLWLAVLLASFPFFALSPPPAAADVIYAFGDVRRLDAPRSTSGTINETIVFSERSAAGDPLSFPVNANERRRYEDEPAMPECNVTVTALSVDSHYVFQSPDVMTQNDGVLVFPGEVVGMSFEDACVAATDGYFLPSGFTYGGGRGLGLSPAEGDVLDLLPSGRTLFHRLRTNTIGDPDGFRVITRAPPEDLDPDLSLECRGLGGLVEPGATEELTLVLRNEGDLDAPDPQIVFRWPRSATVTSLDSSYFDCVEHPLPVRAVACRFSSADGLLHGESAAVRVILSFDDVPMPVERFVGFGSGAVRDPNLENNDCELRAFGPDWDGGLPDGGVRDGAVFDGDVRMDTGSAVRDAGGDGSQASFRGAGGCACRVTTSDGHGGVLGFALAAALLYRRRRRGQTRRSDVHSSEGGSESCVR